MALITMRINGSFAQSQGDACGSRAGTSIRVRRPVSPPTALPLRGWLGGFERLVEDEKIGEQRAQVDRCVEVVDQLRADVGPCEHEPHRTERDASVGVDGAEERGRNRRELRIDARGARTDRGARSPRAPRPCVRGTRERCVPQPRPCPCRGLGPRTRARTRSRFPPLRCAARARREGPACSM